MRELEGNLEDISLNQQYANDGIYLLCRCCSCSKFYPSVRMYVCQLYVKLYAGVLLASDVSGPSCVACAKPECCGLAMLPCHGKAPRRALST